MCVTAYVTSPHLLRWYSSQWVKYLLKNNNGKYSSDHQLQKTYSSVFVVIEKCYVCYVFMCYN